MIGLTKVLATDQRFCRAHFKYAPLVEAFVANHSKPYWNGEDIFHSIISTKVCARTPPLLPPHVFECVAVSRV